MKLFVDVYGADDSTRLGDGPVLSAVSASVKRALDGAGTITLEFPATDKRAIDLIQNERRVRIFIQHGNGQRELGRGVIRSIKVNAAERNTTLVAEGADSLDALKRRSVLLNRQFTNTPISTIAESLVSLVPGWSAVVESGVASALQSVRFDGTSVLKALIRVAEEKGIHLREGIEANTVELGAFGTQTIVVITNVGSVPREMYSNNDVVLIDKLTITQDSEAIANWIVPLGAGEGAAALTLKNSNRSSPYAIQQMIGADGQTLYYLKDDSSIETNGQIEKIVTFKCIAPLNNSVTAKQLAANALYDASAAWLQRNSQRQVTYQVSGVKPRQKIRPGDKIRLVYKGIVWRDNEPVVPVSVDDYFWVLSVTEKVSDTGITVDLEISSIDKRVQDAAQVVVGALEAVDVRNVAVQTYGFWSENTWLDTIQGWTNTTGREFKPAIFKVEIDNAVTDLVKVRIRFKTKPLYALTAFNDYATLASYIYQVINDTHYPMTLSLFINGVDITNEVGGPWNEGGDAPVDVTLDITDYIVNASGGIYRDHSIEFRCVNRVGTTGVANPPAYANINSHGFVELNVRIQGITQAILPT